jgi:hypothetical protein
MRQLTALEMELVGGGYFAWGPNYWSAGSGWSARGPSIFGPVDFDLTSVSGNDLLPWTLQSGQSGIAGGSGDVDGVSLEVGGHHLVPNLLGGGNSWRASTTNGTRTNEIVVVGSRNPHGPEYWDTLYAEMDQQHWENTSGFQLPPGEPVGVPSDVLRTMEAEALAQSDIMVIEGGIKFLVPEGFNVQRLLDAANRINALPVEQRLGEFIRLVGGGGPFDFKTQAPNNAVMVIGQEVISIYEPFGNWAFGFLGAAIGLPDLVLSLGANAAQLLDSFQFDDQRDQGNIFAGTDSYSHFISTGYLPFVEPEDEGGG